MSYICIYVIYMFMALRISPRYDSKWWFSKKEAIVTNEEHHTRTIYLFFNTALLWQPSGLCCIIKFSCFQNFTYSEYPISLH